MGEIGFQELLVIGILVLVLFGGKKLPEMGKGIAEAIKGFKSSLKGDDEPAAAAPPPPEVPKAIEAAHVEKV